MQVITFDGVVGIVIEKDEQFEDRIGEFVVDQGELETDLNYGRGGDDYRGERAEAVLLDSGKFFPFARGGYNKVMLLGTAFAAGLSLPSADEALRFLIQHGNLIKEGSGTVQILLNEGHLGRHEDAGITELTVWREEGQLHIEIEVEPLAEIDTSLGDSVLFIRDRPTT